MLDQSGQQNREKSENTVVSCFLMPLLERDWHMYSQFTPMVANWKLPLRIKGNFNLVGRASKTKHIMIFFRVNGTFFEGRKKAQIRQKCC
jgi:hypothetical protein